MTIGHILLLSPSCPVLAASETGSDYHPIFFSQDRLLEELFCVCIQLLNKTWKEMRATQEDFDKVGYVNPLADWDLFCVEFAVLF